ncbi:hypothetical protein GDO78_006485 [Eleutherodactylus coqui]|uniref:Uncharacterized protein n=1 Tax=Eleutherodactylus coqui TaxID=57060 RepID=A0A8J6FNJ8_ELECQ|nr:hypothetical protein GDO78_006485 [Eleutherodactylus coqui]
MKCQFTLYGIGSLCRSQKVYVKCTKDSAPCSDCSPIRGGHELGGFFFPPTRYTSFKSQDGNVAVMWLTQSKNEGCSCYLQPVENSKSWWTWRTWTFPNIW